MRWSVVGLQSGAAEWVFMGVGYGACASSIIAVLCAGGLGMAPAADFADVIQRSASATPDAENDRAEQEQKHLCNRKTSAAMWTIVYMGYAPTREARAGARDARRRRGRAESYPEGL